MANNLCLGSKNRVAINTLFDIIRYVKTHYNIEVEYGTEFQRQFAEKFLDEILRNFDTALQVHHKKNKVTIVKTFEG